jgi:hypothetical protein
VALSRLVFYPSNVPVRFIYFQIALAYTPPPIVMPPCLTGQLFRVGELIANGQLHKLARDLQNNEGQ